MDALPKQKMASFTMWALLTLLGLAVAGWEFGCRLMALLFAE
ncbi:hypothetical protein GGR92_003650 [Spirosoma lacussanchae]|nr:hypothetical protein [Spirosoma lacussanchae]